MEQVVQVAVRPLERTLYPFQVVHLAVRPLERAAYLLQLTRVASWVV
jgi:hypothetical protein